MSKGWDYEDDHDWSDAIDYAKEGYVYWYGKYYPKESIDSLFPAETEIDPKKLAGVLLVVAGAVVSYWGVTKAVPPVREWWTNTARPRIDDAFKESSREDEPEAHL